MNSKLKKFLINLPTASLIEMSKLLKLSHIVGSKFASFSLSQTGLGLVGLMDSLSSLNTVFLIRTVYALIFGLLPFGITTLFYHLPTYCGGLYSNLNSKILRFSIPLTCIMLFVLHPIGKQAFLYSLYWLIPLVIALLPKRSIFLEAIANTFVTHAVGSIIWLYTKSIDATTWNLLIPKVWAERLLVAMLMTAAYYIIIYLKAQLKTYNRKLEYDTALSCYNGRQQTLG